jgi:hypothetical protein
MVNTATVKSFIFDNLKKVSAETVGWLAILFIHCATIPPLLGLLFGVSDKLPSFDVVLFMWTGLVLLFAKALLIRDMLSVVTISLGFIVQAGLLGFLVFR